MILHSITLSGWRTFLDSITVGPLSEGLNVIHAPNGSGKSTLFEALCRGLLDGHGVGGQEIKTIQPWGRALSPCVTVEFSHESTTYRITKQFLEGGRAELRRKEGEEFLPLADGRKADEQVRELLTQNPPGRGLSQPKNWGLAQALWAPQGDLALGDLSGDLVADIRNALGVQLSETAAGPIEKRIKEAFLQYFSPKGKLKTGAAAPEVVHLKERLAQAKEAQEEATEHLLRYEESSRKVEDLRLQRSQARRDAEELSQIIKQSQSDAETYRALRSEAQKKRDAADTAQARYEKLKQQLDLIQNAEEELKQAQGEQDSLGREAPLKGRELKVREQELASAKAALEDAQQGREAVTQALDQAAAAHRYVDCQARQEARQKKIERIETAAADLEEATETRRKLFAPDKKILNALRKEIKARDEAELRIEASLISLEIVPEKDLDLKCIVGEEQGKRPLSAAAPVEIKGSPEVVAELKGIARLRASGPTGNIEAHRQDRQEAQERIRELTEPYGVSDFDALESLFERAKELDAEMAKAQTEFETLLNEENLDRLKREESKEAAILKALIKDYPEWTSQSPQADRMDQEAADLKRAFEDRLATASAEKEKAQAAFSEAEMQEKVLLAKMSETQKQLDRLEQRLADLRQDGKDAAQRSEELKSYLMRWEAARTSLEELETKLSAYEDDPLAALEKLERRLAAADKSLASARDKEMHAEGTLATLAATGPFSALVKAEEAVERLEADLDREERRLDAIKLLHDTVEACRSEAVAAVSKPVEESATRFLRRIAGPRIGSIQLDDAFTPATILPGALDNGVGIEHLSGGEKEQLYLATRLALAGVLAKEERQLVVLDDVLIATDTARLARIMSILEEAAQQLQILILTCHPERYRGLEGAEFVDLEALLNAP